MSARKVQFVIEKKAMQDALALVRKGPEGAPGTKHPIDVVVRYDTLDGMHEEPPAKGIVTIEGDNLVVTMEEPRG